MRFAIRPCDHHLVVAVLYGTQARLTILKQSPQSDPHTLALNALGWIIVDEERAERFLSLTGLTPDELRASLGYPSTLTAVLDYLCGHEPDLLAAADTLGVRPQDLVAARERLAA
jgi:uncharacterized protein DUF3572